MSLILLSIHCHQANFYNTRLFFSFHENYYKTKKINLCSKQWLSFQVSQTVKTQCYKWICYISSKIMNSNDHKRWDHFSSLYRQSFSQIELWTTRDEETDSVFWARHWGEWSFLEGTSHFEDDLYRKRCYPSGFLSK